ncbi:MAG: hypothetical protein NVS3B1_28000 [Marmoricola sp.]
MTVVLTAAQERALAAINERGFVVAQNADGVRLATVRVLERLGLCTLQVHSVKVQTQWRARWYTDWAARKIEKETP